MDQQEPDKKRAVEDSGRTDDPVTNKAAKTEPDQDVSRRKEIREINRLAARECRARKKRLMAELEKTVSNLTSEHSSLMKQNRELTIRLETLQRTVGMGLSGAAASLPHPGMGSMSNFGQNMAQLGLLNQLQQNKKNSGMQQSSINNNILVSADAMQQQQKQQQQQQEQLHGQQQSVLGGKDLAAGAGFGGLIQNTPV